MYMTRFQKYRAEAFDDLVEKWHKAWPESTDHLPTEILQAKAEFVARMKLAKEAKRSNNQTSLFQSGSTI